MFFNPLFIDTNSSAAVQGQKSAKLGKAQYLFSDIIKISLSQTESASAESTPLFNLSLIGMNSDTTSLIGNPMTATTDSEGTSASGSGDAETALAEFLQLAFNNQDIQASMASAVQNLLQNKETLLSKDTLTEALSQLLQKYQPDSTVEENSAVEESAVAESVSPAGLVTDQILTSLDESGKVILNFNNTDSQIKVELSKPDNEEKELFVSTKIIPITSSNSDKTKKADTSSGQFSEEAPAETTSSSGTKSIFPIAPALQETSLSGGIEIKDNTNSNTSDDIPQISQKDFNIKQSASYPENNIKQSASDSENSITEEINTDNKPASAAQNYLTADKPVISYDTDIKETASGNVPDTKETQNDYKFRIVEISADSSENSREAKIYPLSAFEKNLLNKAEIKYSSTDNNSSKQTAAVSVSEGIEAPAADETISTVAETDGEILKTNNLLFDSSESGQTTEIKEKTVFNTKTILKSKEIKSKTGAEALKLKTETGAAEKDESGEIDVTGNKFTANDTDTVKTAKKTETESISDKQVKTETALKSGKQVSTVVENKTKSAESKNEVKIGQDTEAEKSNVTESDKSALSQNSDQGQKESGSSSNQHSSEKKESSEKQFDITNVTEKEKTVHVKETAVKETAKQADISKTVKTYEVIKEIKSFLEQGSKSTMTLKITPENLGSIKISVDMVNNVVQANIDVDNDSIKQVVQTNLESLKQSLNSSGVNLSTISVNISSSDQQQQQQRTITNSRKRNFNMKNIVTSDDQESAATQKILGYNSYDYIA